jgi:hypothetical protein
MKRLKKVEEVSASRALVKERRGKGTRRSKTKGGKLHSAKG